MAFQLSLRPQTLTKLRRIRPLSSSTPPDSSADTSSAAIPDSSSAAAAAAPPPPPPPSFASPFRDIKDRLRSPPPRRIPDRPLRPPHLTGAPAPASASASNLSDIRKQLAEFRNSSKTSPSTLSFQDVYKKNHLDKPSAAAAADDDNPKRTAQSLATIRESLRKLPVVHPLKPSFRGRDNLASGFTTPIKPDQLPSSFGKENSTDDAKPKAPKTEFLRKYSYEELGEKLRRLRPVVGDNRFSIAELNDRLVKLHELEEKEADLSMGGGIFRDLRESIFRLKEADLNKKEARRDSLSILTNITGMLTPAFMLEPPQEELLEKFNHPDHMSAAEKMKLELQKVRDEFKMSESDCGSTRVQVALLTTKIKHLSSVLHKKDKHSRKGLNEMVQKRKKLLKYLRRTDWDSYCFTLSKLGLRDSPQYKASNYKTKA